MFKLSVVEVAFSPEPNVVNGKANDAPPAPQPVHEVTVKLPIVAVLALKSVVEARPEI